LGTKWQEAEAITCTWVGLFFGVELGAEGGLAVSRHGDPRRR
jgi:hypothetical protein